MAASVDTPVPAEVVANAFVRQYYHILHQSPELVHRFYQEASLMGRPEEDGSLSITTSLEAINEKIMLLNYGDMPVDIKSVDAQDSHKGGVHVLVTGYLTGKLNTLRKFSQAFFLAPQEKGYFVLNDMLRFLDDSDLNSDIVTDVSVPVSEDSVVEEPFAEVHTPVENGDDIVVEEEIPVAEVVDEVQNDAHIVVESSSKIEGAPKKSYASIVMHLKETPATFSPPPTTRKSLQKIVEPMNPPVAPSIIESASTRDSVENENNHEGEGDGYSIYIRGLPMNATVSLLEEVFKKFGAIKNDGIQVRSNRLQAFCFGFVEFEEASSVKKALEASPMSIGARQAFVEEKRSTNSRGSNTGRFQHGRGFGFRNDGMRGPGSYGGGRGYNNNNNRPDFNGRNEFSNRGGNGNGSNRVRPSSREGYHKFNNNNRNNNSGMQNGNNKNITPHVSATA